MEEVQETRAMKLATSVRLLGKKNYFSRSVLFLPTVFLSYFEFKIISYKTDPINRIDLDYLEKHKI